MPGFVGFSAGPSTGQAFRALGQGRGDWTAAVDDIRAMSNRFMFAGQEVAEKALEVMEENIVKYVHPDSSHGFKFSEGRLAATIGTWKPELIKDADVLTQAELWAANNGVDIVETHSGGDEHTLIENGAYKSVKRQRASTWSAEVGTFTPYAGLVEDGGEMPIHPMGNPNVIITAHWEPHHMFSDGMFDSYAELEKIIEGTVRSLLSG